MSPEIVNATLGGKVTDKEKSDNLVSSVLFLSKLNNYLKQKHGASAALLFINNAFNGVTPPKGQEDKAAIAEEILNTNNEETAMILIGMLAFSLSEIPTHYMSERGPSLTTELIEFNGSVGFNYFNSLRQTILGL